MSFNFQNQVIFVCVVIYKLQILPTKKKKKSNVKYNLVSVNA